jgi:hypothetical protein
MSEITRTSFYYDPIRQGYDTNSWRTISGAPAVSAIAGGRISVDNEAGLPGSAVHYADFLKGDISFDVNVPLAPVEGVTRKFGVSAPNTSAYIRFSLTDSFNCETSDGINTTVSSDITWSSDWTGANTIFRIRWEAGGAKFYVNNVQVYAVSDASVPCGPLSWYLYDGADNSMTVGDLITRGTQSFVMNPKTSDSTGTNPIGAISMYQGVTITESVTMLIPTIHIDKYESITVSESVTMRVFANEDFDEDITVTDVVSDLYIPTIHIDLDDDVTVSEDVTMSGSLWVDVNDDVTITEDIVALSYTDEDFDETVTVSDEIIMLIPELLIDLAESDITLTEYVAETRVVGP